MEITAYDLASRFVGIKEVPGSAANPAILAMLKLDGDWPQDDSVPWCSAFANYICWLLGLPRTKSLRARSWLRIPEPLPDPPEVSPGASVTWYLPDIPWEKAERGFDVVILSRGGGNQPGSDVIDAPGHVGFFHGWKIHSESPAEVEILGGNQSDSVSVQSFPASRILGIRRLRS